MIRLTLQKQEAGTKLLRYLTKLLPKAPSGFLHKAARKDMIKVNGRHCKDLSTVLGEGDVIELYVTDRQLGDFGYAKAAAVSVAPRLNELVTELPVLYEDDQIIVVDKPRGLLTQKANTKDLSATEIVRQQLIRKGETLSPTFQPSFCHRLDRNTSGVLIMAKTLEASQQITARLKDHSIEKIYYALVEGVPLEWEEPVHLVNGYQKDEAINKAILTAVSEKEEGAAICESIVRLVESYGRFSLVEVILLTGKSHQIRAQLAFAGYPILSDAKYNPSAKKHAQMLTAKAAVFHGLQGDLSYLNGKKVEAPLPKDMTDAIINLPIIFNS